MIHKDKYYLFERQGFLEVNQFNTIAFFGACSQNVSYEI